MVFRLAAFGLEGKRRQLPFRNIRRIGSHFMINNFAVLAANSNPDLCATKVVLPVSTGQNDMDLAWPGLFLNSGIQTYNARVHLVSETAMQTQRFAGITKNLVFL